MYRLFFKRIIDIFLSLIFILLFWWLYIVIIILVKKKLGSPVLFKQERPGLNEKIFTMYKFRTMTDEKDKNGNLLPDKDRLTKFGRFLRSTSLDEIPELWNVLKGEMSLVGPRPLLIEYLGFYTIEENKRHNVKPGITGWAQINGRNALSWEEKFKYDIEYVNRVSFFFDLKIIFYTIKKVMKKEDITDFKNENKEERFDDYRREKREK